MKPDEPVALMGGRLFCFRGKVPSVDLLKTESQMAKRQSVVTFGPMSGAKDRRQQVIMLAGINVGEIHAYAKQDWTVHGVTYVVKDYTVHLDVPTMNDSDSLEVFRVSQYGSPRSALAAAHDYVKKALGEG